MNDPVFFLWLSVTFAGGIALGGVFFGGLWLTTQMLSMSAGGVLLVPLSFVVRISVVLLGMYWLTAGDWRYVLACLAGFLVARTVILKQVFHSLADQVTGRKETLDEHVT